MRRSERGLSLIEMTVTLAIVSVVMLVVYQLIDETLRMSMFNESHNDLAVMSQRAVNTMQTEILQTKIAYQEDTVGAAYRTAMQLPAGTTVWPDSFLPVFNPTGTITPDLSGERFTGNSMLIARQLPPISVLYDHDSNINTPRVEYLADIYRFEYFYLTRKTTVSFSGAGYTADLNMTASRDFADYFQLEALNNANTATIVQELINAGLQRAWNPGQPLATAFYNLSQATDGTFNAPVNGPTITTVSTQSLLRGLMGGRISGRMLYSIGFTPGAASTAYPLNHPIRVFAQPIAGEPFFPSGFEVKVAGPSKNRQVMTRLVLMSHYGTNQYESQQSFVITAARF